MKKFITSKKIILLLEDYDSSLTKYVNKHGSRTKTLMPIYLNPTSSDYKEIYKDGGHTRIKFIGVNRTKKVYAWDAWYAIHDDVAKHLSLGSNWTSDPEVFAGTATISGGKATMGATDRFDIFKDARNAIKAGDDAWVVDELANQLRINWSWLDKYVDCSKYIANAKSKISSIRSLARKMRV